MKLKLAFRGQHVWRGVKSVAGDAGRAAAKGVKSFARNPIATHSAGGAVLGGASMGLLGYSQKYDPKTHKYIKKKDRKKNAIRAGIAGAVSGGLYGASLGIEKSIADDSRRAAYEAYTRAHSHGYHGSHSTTGNWWDDPNAGRPRGAGGNPFRSKSQPGPVPDWLHGVKTKAEAKTKWREVARKHHPDMGGNAETFKRYNNEWDHFEKHHFSKLSHVMIEAFMNEITSISRSMR